MSLLKEIKNTLVEPDCDLPSLLRKCKILAYDLCSKEFKTWLENELSGYKSKEELPKYRILDVQSEGFFEGRFGRRFDHAPIPMMTIPIEYRDILSHSYILDSVAALENLVESSKNTGILGETWDANATAIWGRKIYQDMVCLEARKIIPASSIVAILDEVKNRILNFVLEIEAQGFDVEGFNVNKSKSEKVTQIFNTTINGTVQNLATGSHDFKQIANTPELFDNLIKAAQKIEDRSVSEEFIGHIENMKSADSKEGFKSHYNGFIASLANHATVASFFVPFLSNLSQLL